MLGRFLLLAEYSWSHRASNRCRSLLLSVFSPIVSPPTVKQNHKAFQGLLDKAVVAASADGRGIPELQAAATFAADHHTGEYASSDLEALFRQIAPAFPRVGRRGGGGAPRVLLVMTQDRGLRGPSMTVHRLPRLAEGSIQHTIVMTNQRVPIPRIPGTKQIALTGTVMERVRQLQSIAANNDAVIAAVNPADVVPAIALADRPRGAPGVGFLNLAAQTHWVGAGAADFVINHDWGSAMLAADRRGVRRQALTELRIPIPPDHLTPTMRARVRMQLGIDDKSTILFTSGPSAKFRPIEPGLGFLDLVVPVIASNPKAVLVAVGPGDDPDWIRAGDKTDGRIRSLPLGFHAHDVRRAADVYLDPFPFSSSTAALEAGLQRLPVLACSRYLDDRARILISGVGEFGMLSPEPAHFQRILHLLINDTDYRRSCGELLGAGLSSRHWGPVLGSQYRGLVDILMSGPNADTSISPYSPRFDLTDCLIAAFQHNRMETRPEYSRDMGSATDLSFGPSFERLQRAPT
jgi:hypothetical protein